MVDGFQIGSLTDLVERKERTMKTKLSPFMKAKKIVMKNKKKSMLMNKNKKFVVLKNESSIMKNKKKGKQLTTTIEPIEDEEEADDSLVVDPEIDAADNSDDNDDDDDDVEQSKNSTTNKSEQDSSGKQLRTLFIGNLPANFPMKVCCKLFVFSETVGDQIVCCFFLIIYSVNRKKNFPLNPQTHTHTDDDGWIKFSK